MVTKINKLKIMKVSFMVYWRLDIVYTDGLFILKTV